MWIRESDSIRRLSDLSGHSEFKIKRIKNYWLQQTPQQSFEFSEIKYLIYDGTYFHKTNCFVCLMNGINQSLPAFTHAPKEAHPNVYVWLQGLKRRGLFPLVITMDGERSIIQAIQKIWPNTCIQRCLYHIQMQGMSWLRSYPKTQAGKDLRILLSQLCNIRDFKARNQWIQSFEIWRIRYKNFIHKLPSSSVAFKDLKRTVSLIKNALPHMFHYLNDQNIHPTTNALESFYSRLKADYRRHRGLSEAHRKSYLNWYCYFKNSAISNTF